MPQVFNQNVVLSFTAGVQQQTVRINVPFRVGRIVFHPPRAFLGAGVADNYLLSSSLNKGGGVIGYLDGVIGGLPQPVPISISVEDPLFVNGEHKFQIRSLAEVGGGAATAATVQLWQLIEFHEAQVLPTAFVHT
jgi:hypothetical protein